MILKVEDAIKSLRRTDPAQSTLGGISRLYSRTDKKSFKLNL